MDHCACGYRNATDRMVILRCIGPDAFFLERVVFPFDLLSFECPPTAEIEIWTHSLGGPELLEQLLATNLLLEEAESPFLGMAERPGSSPIFLQQPEPWMAAG